MGRHDEFNMSNDVKHRIYRDLCASLDVADLTRAGWFDPVHELSRGELDEDSTPVSRPLNIAHNTLPQVFARMGLLPLMEFLPESLRRDRMPYTDGIGGSSTSTDGRRIGSARRSRP
jgi:hypothetical protein